MDAAMEARGGMPTFGTALIAGTYSLCRYTIIGKAGLPLPSLKGSDGVFSCQNG